MGGDSFSTETTAVNETNGKRTTTENETNSSTEVFTRRFYILAVFSIFTMEQVGKHVFLLTNWMIEFRKVLYFLFWTFSWVWCCVPLQNHFICISIFLQPDVKYLDNLLLYFCICFPVLEVLIFFVQTAFIFILMGLLQPKRTKLCWRGTEFSSQILNVLIFIF